MNRFIGLVLVTVLFATCKTLTKTSDDQTKFDFEELNYGMPTATEQYKIQSGGPTGEHGFASDYRLTNRTDTIIGELGNRMGVQYILKSNRNTNIPITQIWIFPKRMINDKGESFERLEYTIQKPTNDSTWVSFRFVKDFEILNGQWIFQAYYGDRKLHERRFFVKRIIK